MGFNGSSNPYIDNALGLIQGLAVEEYRLDHKKKQAAAMLKQLQDSGMVAGGETAADPTRGFKLSTPEARGLMPQVAAPQGMMSLANGGIGDAEGNPIAPMVQQKPRMLTAPKKAPMLAPASAAKRTSPFILNPASAMKGDLDVMANPDYESAKTLKTQRNQAIGASSRIRTEFINRPEVKEYTTVKSAVNAMESLMKSSESGDNENKVAIDQGLVTLYNKMTDPQSVVRESEYARTPSNLPTINRIQGALEKLAKGGAGLTDDDRRALVVGAKIIANERGKIYQDTLDEYKTLAGEYDIDPNLITRGVKDHADYSLNMGTGKGKGKAMAKPMFTKDQLQAEYNRRKKAGLIK